MGNTLNVIAAILVITWLIALFGLNAGGIMHGLLVLAIIALVLRVIQRKSV